MPDIIIFTDGGARGNPGPAGIGVVIEDGAGNVLKEFGAYIGKTTNNMAEYEALIRALQAAKELFGTALREKKIEVRLDSELVVRQLEGAYRVKEPSLKSQYAKIAAIKMEDAPNLAFVHIPREKNARADKLVNAALDAYL